MSSELIKSFDLVIQTVCDNYKQSNDGSISLQLLIFLKTKLRNCRNEYLFKVTNQLLGPRGIFRTILEAEKLPDNVYLNILQCIEILVSNKDTFLKDLSINTYDNCISTYIFNFVILKLLNSPDKITVLLCKIKLSLLNILSNLLAATLSLIDICPGKLFGICKSGMFFPEFQACDLFPISLTSQESLKISKKVDKNMKKVYRKKNKLDTSNNNNNNNNRSVVNGANCNHFISFVTSSSTDNFDSEFSENEKNEPKQIEKLSYRIRLMSCKLLGLVIEKSTKKAVCDYWFHFVSDDTNSNNSSLITFFNQNNQFKKSQVNALIVLKLLIAESRPFLKYAEFRKSSVKSFTSLADVLGYSIIELHTFLFKVLSDTRNNSGLVQLQALKCLECLIQISPYNKLVDDNIIGDIINIVYEFINNNDNEIKIAILCIIRCLIQSQLSETQFYFISNKLANSNPSILIECFKNFNFVWSSEKNNFINSSSKLNTLSSLRIESLQLIKSLLTNLQDKLVIYQNTLFEILRINLNDELISVKLHTLRTIESISKTVIDETFLENMWNCLLNDNCLIEFLQKEKLSILIASSCDCFASFNINVFRKLPEPMQLFILNFLLNSCQNLNENVQTSAMISISDFIRNYPEILNHNTYIKTLLNCLCTELTHNLDKVRIQASMTLCALINELVNVIKQNENCVSFDQIAIRNLLEVSQQYFTLHNYKILSNLIQILYNSIRIAEMNNYPDEIQEILDFLLTCLKTCPNLKVKWNICYAFYNLFKTTKFLHNSQISSKDRIVTELCSCLDNSDNFKVRTNAVIALKASSNDKSNFKILSSLTKAFDKAQLIDDFNELNHQKNLIEQICSAMIHFIKLLAFEDFDKFNTEIVESCGQVLQNALKDYYNQNIEIYNDLNEFQIGILNKFLLKKG